MTLPLDDARFPLEMLWAQIGANDCGGAVIARKDEAQIRFTRSNRVLTTNR